MFLCQPIYTDFVTGKLQITGEVTRLYASRYFFFQNPYFNGMTNSKPVDREEEFSKARSYFSQPGHPHK